MPGLIKILLATISTLLTPVPEEPKGEGLETPEKLTKILTEQEEYDPSMCRPYE